MMTYLEEISGILGQLKPQLAEKYGVDTLGLFGSIVRDDFTPESDIDIIVSFSKPIGLEFITWPMNLRKSLTEKLIWYQGGASNRSILIT